MRNTDFYQTVTARVVAALETGTAPWVRPWSVLGEQRPHNGISKRPYRGINTWLLTWEAEEHGYATPLWLTFRQAVGLGAKVRRGERGTTVMYYQLRELPGEGPEPDSASTKVVPLLRTYTVFNVAQIDGLPAQYTESLVPPTWEPQAEAERLLVVSGARIEHGGDRAYYHPPLDYIQLPLRRAFTDATAYYAVALHELTHWTAHPERCARELGKRFGDAAYAVEELIAEMGSAFLCAHCRLDGQLQHPAYLANWLRVLRQDARAIFTVAAKAQQAADLLIGRTDALDRNSEGRTLTTGAHS